MELKFKVQLYIFYMTIVRSDRLDVISLMRSIYKTLIKNIVHHISSPNDYSWDKVSFMLPIRYPAKSTVTKTKPISLKYSVIFLATLGSTNLPICSDETSIRAKLL